MKSLKKLLKLSRGQWISVAVLASSLGLAVAVTVPNSFTTGTAISASQMNANFVALVTAVTTAETAITTANTQIATLNTAVTRQSGIKFSNNIAETPVTVAAVMQAVTVTAPTAGFVVVNTSGYFVLGATGLARCSITTSTTAIDFNFLIIGGGGTGQAYMPFAGTRGFAVAAGANTFNLVCDAFTGTPSIGRPVLTAIFSPVQL